MVGRDDARWHARLAQVVAWQAEHGRPPRASPAAGVDERRLGQWLGTNRMLARRGDLAPDRAEALHREGLTAQRYAARLADPADQASRDRTIGELVAAGRTREEIQAACGDISNALLDGALRRLGLVLPPPPQGYPSRPTDAAVRATRARVRAIRDAMPLASHAMIARHAGVSEATVRKALSP